MNQNSALLRKFYSHLSHLAQLKGIYSLLDWDQQVYMPSFGAESRSKQMEILSTLIHKCATSADLISLLDLLEPVTNRLSADDEVNIREVRRVTTLLLRLPEDFVAEMARLRATTYQAWVISRPKDDFETVRPFLEKIVDGLRKEADLLGYDDHPYDALLNGYEPGLKAKEAIRVLKDLADNLRELIAPIQNAQKCVDWPQAQELTMAISSQRKLSNRLVERLGFPSCSGRLDPTSHPFQSTVGPGDVRITTRFIRTNFLSSIYSTLHEVGHAFYELGLQKEWYGTPCGQPVSLSIHESQSRLWENMIGRSRAFMTFLYQQLILVDKRFRGTWNEDSLWYRVNRVRPSLIRVEADEVTYALHVVVRTILEEQLISGKLAVKELPEAWNALYKEYLGISPCRNGDGVLQDVHWFIGSMGYFPTYALGNLYAAAIFDRITSEIPDINQQIEAGSFKAILEWLVAHIYAFGMRENADALVRRISGNPLSAEPFLRYLNRKFRG